MASPARSLALGDSSSAHKITYPPEWSDKDRMGYLLAPFPPSDKPLDLNDSKFRFWSSLILSSSKELLKPFASVRDLQERFRWNGQSTPGCLNTVLEGMERTGEATKMPDFYQAEQSWLSWGANVVKKPVAWALKSYLPTSKYEGDYIINNVARDCAATVMDTHQQTVLYKCTDNIMKRGDFEKLCSRCGLAATPALTSLLVQQLSRDGRLVRRTSEDGHEVIKLSPVRDGGMKVTDVDLGIIHIKETIAELSAQVKGLEELISRLKLSAKEQLKRKDKKEALRFLRLSASKRPHLEGRQAMLDNLQAVLHRIQSAETDAMVFSAYKVGLDALRSMQGDLTLEKVEDVKADVQKLLEDGEDVAAVLGEGVPNGEAEDGDAELLLELEQLIEEDRGAEAAHGGGEEEQLGAMMAGLSVRDKREDSSSPLGRGRIHDTGQFPAVPTHSPQARTSKDTLTPKKRQALF